MLKSFISLCRNTYFWMGLGSLLAVGVIFLVIMDTWIMPAYTRHGVTVTVPDVLEESFEEARIRLEEQNFRVEEILLRKPRMERNVVLDQNPQPGAEVKPGRHVYLTVNAGDTTMVLVPRVEGISLREAENRIMILGLAVSEVLPDSFPSPHINTVTRQVPEAGSRVPPDTAVRLWISTGLGDRQVVVPDVRRISLEQAENRLHSVRLNSFVIGTLNESDTSRIVQNQSPGAGTAVREGVVVRLYLNDADSSNR